MKIARVILNLNCSKDEIFDNNNPWGNHKGEVSSYFINNKKTYYRRIENIIAIASENKCDILLLPACTFIYKSKKDYEKYLSMIPKSMTVFTGTLELKKNSMIERAVIIKSQKTVDVFDSSYLNTFMYGSVPVYCAISSTIANIHKDGEIKDNFKNGAEYKKAIALDMGHHQYNGRYMLTLKAVLGKLMRNYKGKHTVILSFWRYNCWNINANWYQSNQKLKEKRFFSNDDIVDIIDI